MKRWKCNTFGVSFVVTCFWRGVSVIYSVDVTWINTMSDRIMIELVSFLQPTLFANT